jgi:hypothetical protein
MRLGERLVRLVDVGDLAGRPIEHRRIGQHCEDALDVADTIGNAVAWLM